MYCHYGFSASYRKNGRIKQKVIANLGRRETLEAVLSMLNRFCAVMMTHTTGQRVASQRRSFDNVMTNKKSDPCYTRTYKRTC